MTLVRLLPAFALCITSLVPAACAAQDPPAEFSSIEVRIETQNPDTRLAGTLSLPPGSGPYPAALLITGDGEHTRDQVISGTPMFRQIAEHLTRSGIAVLRVDDRGVGASTGPSVEEATLLERAADMRACVRFLRERPEIDAGRIGLVGHSAGAIVGPMLAAEDTTLHFLVLLAPTAIPGGAVWMAQQVANLKRLGAAPEVIPAVEGELRRVVDLIRDDYSDDASFYAIGHDFVAAHGVERDQITDGMVDQLLGGLRSEAHRFFFTYDPGETLGRVHMPTLVLVGSRDGQVVPNAHLGPLTEALLAAGNADFSVNVLPEQDHFFLEYQGRRLDQHQFGEMQVAPALLNHMTGWILARVSGRAG
ncbi:MAG: alpha/beta fold hydrolase [Rhodothermales bacterium]|nr:alpha/beta fold hydrolase [Rhodothermales bacterium]MBO6780846.1 alpha/beta fold hydrolase [Rhodothermales bacterium]